MGVALTHAKRIECKGSVCITYKYTDSASGDFNSKYFYRSEREPHVKTPKSDRTAK